MLVEEYNQKLKSESQTIAVVSWSAGRVELSNGIILSANEIRKFRMHVNSPTLKHRIDELYGSNTNDQIRTLLIKKIQQENASIKNKLYWQKLDPVVVEQKREHMRKIQKMVDRSSISFPEPWNKGRTKHDDRRLMKNSEDRTGEKNPMYGHRWPDEYKLQKSEWAKDRIERGTWTPHVHNSRTHWDCQYNGKRYRSSWEAMYASINPHDLYEHVRIPYVVNNRRKIYIVDFCNHETKTLTEIKPIAHTHTAEYCAKVKAAEDWCDANGYVFIVVTEHYFVYNYHKIPFDELNIPNIREKIARIKSEADKQN